MGVLTHFTPPFVLFRLAYHDPCSMSGCICHGVHYLPASMALTSFPLPYIHVPSKVCSHITLPEVFTCLLWMLLVDIHSRSHNFPFFHPREALLVGCWVTTLPLFSCGIHFFSPLTEVVLHGVGLVHLSHA